MLLVNQHGQMKAWVWIRTGAVDGTRKDKGLELLIVSKLFCLCFPIIVYVRRTLVLHNLHISQGSTSPVWCQNRNIFQFAEAFFLIPTDAKGSAVKIQKAPRPSLL